MAISAVSKRNIYPRIALAGAVSALILGGAGLGEWVSGGSFFAGFHPEYIPMAPSTALAFILLSVALLIYLITPQNRAGGYSAAAASFLVALFGLLMVIQFIFGLDLPLERVLFRTSQSLGSIPLGRMSPLTAANLLFAGLALLLLLAAPARWQHSFKKTASFLAVMVAATGLMLVLGYLYGAPFFYGKNIIPVAFTTAAAFVFVSVGLIASLGPEFWPLSSLTGSTVRARLLRGFLPLVIIIFLAEDWFIAAVSRQLNINLALISTWTAILLVLVLTFLISRMAQVIGGDIERTQTERRHAEETLRQSEERFRALAQSANDAIISADSWGIVVSWNQGAKKIFGYEEEEVLGRPVALLMPERYRNYHHQGLERMRSTGKSMIMGKTIEAEGLRKDGGEFPLEISIAMWKIGKETFYSGIIRDITERRQAEEALLQSEERYRLLFESNPQPMYVYDLETLGFLAVNEAAVHQYGYSYAEFKKMTLADLRLPEDVPEFLEQIPKIPAGISQSGPLRHRKKNGNIIYVETVSYGILFDHRPARLVLAKDITEQKLLEEQLRQSQKMEAVGTLAGGVAHDFNNLLTAIMGNLELVKFKAQKGKPLEAHLEEIAHVTDRAALLTRQLLAFSRRQILQPVPLNLNDTVYNMNKILPRLLGEHIELELHLESKLALVKADPGQMEQVIMNLCVNARDAMPKGGKLVIKTQSATLDGNYTKSHPWIQSGDYVLLEIEDNGCGMDKSTLERVFEPFFTTKEPGKGTGLGLSMVYGIVKQHQGFIHAYSEPGQGTSFKIYLPRLEEAAAVEEVKQESPRAETGKETILVAEDEDYLRENLQEILEMFGYNVLAAKDGQEAVDLYEQEKGRIDLVILDAVMPRRGGKEAANCIYEINPAQKILFSSGYSAEGIHESFTLPAGVHFLQKPYTAKALAQKVREVLEKDED